MAMGFASPSINALKKINTKESDLLMYSIIEGNFETCRLNLSWLIAMWEPTGSLFYVAPRLLSSDKYQKTTAIEAIETVLQRELHQKISLIYFENDFNKIASAAMDQYELSKPGLDEIMDHYLHNKTFNWSMTCALYYQISTNPEEKTDLRKKELHNLLTK